MRLRSFAFLSVLVWVTACSRRDAGARASADSAAIPDTSSAAVQPGPDPVITDSHTIYEARNLAGQPYWAVDIFGQGIRYRTAGDTARGVVFGAGRVEGDDSASVWTAKRNALSGPKSLQLQILRLPCANGADGAQAYRVALLIDGQATQGCAKRGTQATRRS